MFVRVLSAWAADLLRLRRAGLLTPCHRPGDPDVVVPSRGLSITSSRWPTFDPAAALRWRAA
jgi:hypothetical protein